MLKKVRTNLLLSQFGTFSSLFLFVVVGRTGAGPASSKESNPVISARGKLKGVLNALQSEEREEEANTSVTSTKKAKPAVKSSEATESNAAKEKNDKKNSKELLDKQQQSYIMKLFDRSVNLAKFEEGTPLYPL